MTPRPAPAAVADADLERALADVFGFHAFRPHQRDIVRAVLDRRDVFAVMPTGGGKSLCYQLPARILPGVCVVVSPLLALMKDQVDAARANGLSAAALNSLTAPAERQAIARALAEGALDLLYVSPERFNSEGFVPWLRGRRVSFFAVDEAHCISAWGHDFRPDYLALSRIAGEFPDTPVAAFTATATERVAEDIVSRLGLRDPHRTRASFNRPNLFYQVTPKERFDDQLDAFLKKRPGQSGIVYRITRREVERTAKALRDLGYIAAAYHAGLPDAERARTQDAFRVDDVPIIVATVAFGMGVDKPNVRFVVHGDLPKNLEAYYQETGRAGRDGDPAHCALFYGRGDAAQQARFVAEMADPEAREAAFAQLRAMTGFAAAHGCRRAALLAYFDETLIGECAGCDVCAGHVERVDATVSAQKALSAVARTGGRFGVGHLVEILTGSKNKKIIERGHDRLPTHGVGRDRDKGYWRGVYGTLIADGYLRIDDPEFPIPSFTDAGVELMKGRSRFMLRQAIEAAAPAAATRTRGGGVSADVEDAGPYSMALFEKLRDARMDLARAAGVPTYVVGHDRTLRDIARREPRTPDELLECHGIGVSKLEKYGRAFLAVVAAHRAETDAAAD